MDRLEKRYLIARLVAAEVTGTLREEERRELEAWMAASDANRREHARLTRRLEREVAGGERLDVEREWQALARQLKARRAARRAWRGVAAAVAVVAIVAGGYRYLSREGEPAVVAAAGIVKRHVATLVLAGGERVMISDSSRGVISDAGGTVVTTRDNRLEYAARDEGSRLPAARHEVIVPRGGEYELLLSDGTRVWLNSGSRVSFPDRFDGETREVEMQGEACFEVAAREGQPFIVKTGDVALRVLGTLFNVEAYPGEPVVATLVNGSLQLAAGSRERLLRPGERATVVDGEVTVRETRAAEAVEWIHGVFNFTETSLRTIMTRLARWYDVEVEYRGPAAGDARFTLEIRRYENIASVLSKIEMTGRVRFAIEGNKVFVEE